MRKLNGGLSRKPAYCIKHIKQPRNGRCRCWYDEIGDKYLKGGYKEKVNIEKKKK